MNRTPAHQDNAHSDAGKADTPDKFRNDKARWKDHDMPDDRDGHKTDPERDYPDAGEGTPR